VVIVRRQGRASTDGGWAPRPAAFVAGGTPECARFF
jgi:hypothetical protein